MSDVPLLELENLCYSYGHDHANALDNVSATIREGERIAVLGNNGAGKSTFFLCCNGVIQPDSGSIRLDGRPISRKKADLLKLRQAIGLVFQDPDDQIIASTVESEVSFGPMNLGLEEARVKDRVDESLGDMSLLDYRERPAHHLSGGEKKRVTIADILAMQPRMILFDEPTSSLDPCNTGRLQDIMHRLSNGGMALMVATHDIEFAWEWAERALVFSGGELLADASTDEVFADDELLQQAGLHRPLIYTATQAVCSARRSVFPSAPPRTADDFTQFVKELLA